MLKLIFCFLSRSNLESNRFNTFFLIYWTTASRWCANPHTAPEILYWSYSCFLSTCNVADLHNVHVYFFVQLRLMHWLNSAPANIVVMTSLCLHYIFAEMYGIWAIAACVSWSQSDGKPFWDEFDLRASAWPRKCFWRLVKGVVKARGY